MWPTLNDGDIIEAIQGSTPEVGSVVVFKHPFKNQTLIKRIKYVDATRFFVEGDNPDPVGSEDSHNFGLVESSSIIAVIHD